MSVEAQLAVLEEKTSRHESDIEKIEKIMGETAKTLNKLAEQQLRSENAMERFTEAIGIEFENHKKKVTELDQGLKECNERMDALQKLVEALDAFKRQLKRDVKITTFIISSLVGFVTWLAKVLPT